MIGHSCWSVATATNILLVKCIWKKAGYKSGAMSADPVPPSDMPACTVQLCQICRLGSFIRYTCL